MQLQNRNWLRERTRAEEMRLRRDEPPEKGLVRDVLPPRIGGCGLAYCDSAIDERISRARLIA
jgi:hypothetical protein